jgi:C-terminal processing protease CtpA/Prc
MTILFLLMAGGLTGGALPSHPINLDVEQPADAGERPVGWEVAGEGASVVLSSKLVRQGRASAVLRNQGEGAAQLFQTLDAHPFQGKTVSFRAALRADAKAWLWMRASGAGAEVAVQSSDRAVAEGEWRDFDLVLAIPPSASTVRVGVTLAGRGRLSFDDAHFGIVGVGDAPARRLTERGIVNLLALARLLGYVRYFHPSGEAADADWGALAIAAIRPVEAASAAQLAAVLQALFRPLARDLVVATTPRTQTAASPREPRRAWLYHGPESVDITATPYRRERIEIAPGETLPNEGRPFTAQLAPGLFCSLPLTVSPRAPAVLPKPTRAGKPRDFIASGRDRDTRLAGVLVAWNMFQHFYPYFDVVEVDWAGVLREALARAALDRDELAFRDTLRWMVAQLRDGHGAVFFGGRRPTHQLPLGWAWIEGQLRVTMVGPGVERVAPGDIVERIGARTALETLTAAEALQGAATASRRRFSALRELLSGVAGETVTLHLRSASQTVDLEIRRSAVLGSVPLEPRPPAISDVAPGVLYLDLTRISDADVAAALPRLIAARGAVLDVRGYPRPTQAFLGYLSDHSLVGGSGCVPLVRLPDRRELTFECTESRIEPALPRVRAPLVFLTDARAMSYGETIMATVEHERLGAIVGSETAGTNGNVHSFSLPGGYQIKWTAMKVVKPGGAQLHGIGVPPIVRVDPTADGVTARRDEGVRKALEVLRNATPETRERGAGR